MTTGYTKRALKSNGNGGLCLDCECGHRLSIPEIAHLPMTHICQCGIEYDSRGWIISRPAGASDKPSHFATVLP